MPGGLRRQTVEGKTAFVGASCGAAGVLSGLCLIAADVIGLPPARPDGRTEGGRRTTNEQRADPSAGLELQIAGRAPAFSTIEPVHLTWTLKNATRRDVLVVSHYSTGDQRHFDNLELRIVRREDRKAWTIRPSGPRKAAAKVGCLLTPGGTARHDLDLSYWTRLRRIDLGTGSFDIIATYRVAEGERPMSEWANCEEVLTGGSREPRLRSGPPRDPWRGVLESKAITLQIGN